MKKIVSIILCLTFAFVFSGIASADNTYNIDDVISDTANYIHNAVSDPQVGSVGGEWAVLGLARSEAEIPEEYYKAYYERVEEYVKEREGRLHNKKYTEYSRLVLALTAIGKNPKDVAGYNLLTPLGDYEKAIWQGINGAIWALIALDSGNYDMPQNPDAKIQATREMYVNHILEMQTPDGGWALTGNVADPDVTGMALQALSKYQNNGKVKAATEKALICLSDMQDENGGFSSYATENSESCVQAVVALCELGIPVDDSRFVKNGYTILDNLMKYYDKGNGFRHTVDASRVDLMSTEQIFYGIVAVKRMNDGKSSLYRMNDAIPVSGKTDAENDNKSEQADEKNVFDLFVGGKIENCFERNSAELIAKIASILGNVQKPKFT